MKKLKGFTLIELVIVIAILAILAAVAIPRFVDLSTKARKATAEAELGALRAAANLYYASVAVRGTAQFPQSTSRLMSYLQKLPTQLWCRTSVAWACDTSITYAPFPWAYNKTTGAITKVGTAVTPGWGW